MAALRPSVIVVGLDGIDFLVAGIVLALATSTLAITACHDAEWRKFLGSDKLISHHVGPTNLKPTFDGIVLTGNQSDTEGRLSLSGVIATHLMVQVVAHHTVLDVGHVHIVECGSRVVANARLETFRWGEVHVLWISHGGSVDEEVIGESLVDMLVDLRTPHAVAVALHGDGLAEDLASQLHLLGIGGLHAEDHTVVLIFGREDGTGEEASHYTSRELWFLACGGEGGLSILHSLLGSLGLEEQREGLAQEILSVHPSVAELVVGIFLHTADAVVVEEGHIIAGVAIEEVIGAHTEPKQTDLAVRILGVVVDPGDVRRGERAVAAQIGELVQMAQAVEERLVATSRETANGAVVSIVDGTVVALYVGHQIVVEVEAEHIAPESRSRCSEHARRWCGQKLIRVAVWQHNDHLLGLALCEQVVENIVHAPHLVVDLLSIGSTADAVEYGIFLVRILLVLRRQIDHGLIRGPETLGVVMDVFHLTVGHILDVVGQSLLAGNLQQTVLETLIREVLGILRIHHAHTVDNKTVGIHVGSDGAEGDGPESCLGIPRHGVAPGKLYIDQHLLGLVVLVLERHGSVGIANGLSDANQMTINH